MLDRRWADARAPRALQHVRTRVDAVLERFLRDRRAELAAVDPAAASLAEELERILAAGGKRIRPALCFWAHRAAGGSEGEPILRACAALELLHTAALVHDDVMDREDERRGVPSTHVRFAEEAPAGVEPELFGTSAAILVGDLALVLSDRLLRTSGFGAEVLRRAGPRFDRMREEMAAGQFLDVAGAPHRDRVAALKSGSYTADGPVLIGATLAGADASVEGSLRAYARSVGEAFQMRDDIIDGDAPPGNAERVDEIVGAAVRSLDDAPLVVEGADALIELAELLRLPGMSGSPRMQEGSA